MSAYQSPNNGHYKIADNIQGLLPQGFELPRGCLMTAVFILLPILTMAISLVRANNSTDVLLAVLIPAAWISIYALAQMITKRTGLS